MANLVGSYSLLNSFESCNKKAYHHYVLKDVPYVESPEMQRGNEVHSAMEAGLKGKPVEPKFELYAPMVQALLYQPAEDRGTEKKLAIREDGSPCDFLAHDVWFRGKVDAYAISGTNAAVIDWKTGKVREDPDELEIFALLLKAKHPELQRITGHYVWLTTPKVGLAHNLSGTDAKLIELHRRMQRLKEAQSRQHWPPTQGPLCDWCRVRACEFFTGRKI